MSSIERGSFFQDVEAFVSNHKVISILTFGLAVVGYSIGNLAGRAVKWICKWTGITKKTHEIGLKSLADLPAPPKKEMNSLTAQISASNLNSAVPVNLTEEEVPQSTRNLLNAYKTPTEGWVIVPPKDEMQIDKPFVIGSGAVGFNGNGRWKIHVNIDPNQMEQAIPIFMDVLYSSDAPRLGVKMQTKANLDSVHQIGKEFAIIFDKTVETAALHGNRSAVENCLSTLWNRLYEAGIRPEPGFVLTPQTMEMIKTAPQESQVKEKHNLKMGKFDRAIPCPGNCNFFYYRDEQFAPMLDEEIGDLRGVPGVYAASDIIELARRQPDLAHNPTQSPDPFLNLHIQKKLL